MQSNTGKGDFNQCRNFYSDLQKCNDEAIAKKEEEHQESNIDKSLSGALQAALPRVFKNAEDLPRERTILADTLAKVAPQIFDPKVNHPSLYFTEVLLT